MKWDKKRRLLRVIEKLEKGKKHIVYNIEITLGKYLNEYQKNQLYALLNNVNNWRERRDLLIYFIVKNLL